MSEVEIETLVTRVKRCTGNEKDVLDRCGYQACGPTHAMY